MKDTARAAAGLGVEVVTGFTGSSTWHLLYSFPPNDFEAVERGYEDFAERWGPIVDVFEAEGEVRPGGPPDRDRVRLRDHAQGARGDRRAPALGSTSIPATWSTSSSTRRRSSTSSARGSTTSVIKDALSIDGRSSILGGHLNFWEQGRGWDFVSPGHGDVDFEEMFRALNRIGYSGPLSIEWEDSGWTATGVRRTRLRSCAAPPSEVAFDAAFAKEA